MFPASPVSAIHDTEIAKKHRYSGAFEGGTTDEIMVETTKGYSRKGGGLISHISALKSFASAASFRT